MRRPRRSMALVQLALCLGLWLGLVAPVAPAVAARPPAAAALAAAGPAGGRAAPLAAQPAAAAPAALGPAVKGVAGLPDGAREGPALRTRSGRVYANPNGTFTARTTAGPQNYKDAAGAWQPIDDTLVPDGAGGYTTKADGYAAHLPASLGGPVSVTAGSRSLSMALQGAGGAAAVSGATATYANALPGVAVAYAAGPAGLKEDLTLASAAAARPFVFTLATAGVTARANAAGGVDFLDGSGKVAFAFAAPSLRDAAGARSRAATLALGRAGGAQAVRLAADPAWLAAPARRYPVVLDPVIVVTAGDTQDCNIVAATPDTDWCRTTLDIGLSGGQPERDLVQFNVHATADNVVLGAEVGLYLLRTATTNPTSLNMHQVTRAWTTGATWNTDDGTNAWGTPGGDYVATPAPQVADVGATSGVWVKFTPGALVAAWNDGSVANDGVLIKEADETVNNELTFCEAGVPADCPSSEAPYISIVFTYDLGARPFYAMHRQGLTDRMALSLNLTNGNLLLQARDLAITGTGLDLVVDRRYQSRDATGGQDLGNRWQVSSYDRGLWFVDGNANAVFFESDAGYYVPFFQDQNGNYLSPPGLDATLVRNQDQTFTLTWQHTGVREDFPASAGLPTKVVDKDGNALVYGGGGGTSTITDTQGRVTTFNYGGPNGWISQVADPSGRTVKYHYNAAGDLDQSTDAAGKLTTYAYDGSHNLTQITDPLGDVTTIGYDGGYNGKVTSITYGAGSPVAATYQFGYDTSGGPASTVTTVTDPNQHQTKYTTDIYGRITKAVDALGDTFQWAWTADDHPSVYTDAKDQQFQYGYDANNNPTGVTLPTGAHTGAVYGTVANIPNFSVPTSATDAQGNQVSYGYDANGDLTSVQATATVNGTVATITAAIGYNANGTPAWAKDFNGNQTSYGYDAKGNLTAVTPPAPLGAMSFGYDGLSRATSFLDGKNQQTSYSYDLLDRVTRFGYADGSAVASTPDADGNVLSMADATGTTAYAYDARNRQTQKTLPGGAVMRYGYDGASNLTSYQDAGGTVAYGYNAADEVTSLTDPSNAQTTFAYDPNHRRTGTTYPDGVVMSQVYDNSQRLTSIAAKNSAGTTLSSFTYSYTNPASGKDALLDYSVGEQLMTAGNGGTITATTALSYDQMNRLLDWKKTNSGTGALMSEFAYQYDAVGNRTSMNATGTLTTFAFNAANELTRASGASSYTDYAYDANGSMLTTRSSATGTGQTLTYNAQNQTASITDTNLNPVPMTYSGLGEGQLVAAGGSVGGGYAYGALGLMSQATSAGTTYYTRDPAGTLVSQRTPSGTQYFLFDGEGSVVAIEDPGTVVDSFEYCPTGNDLGTTGSVPVLFRQGSMPYFSQVNGYQSAAGWTNPDFGHTNHDSGFCLDLFSHEFCIDFHPVPGPGGMTVSPSLVHGQDPGGEGGGGGGGGEGPRITITPGAIGHVIDEHTPGGVESAGNSTFLRSLSQQDIEGLIQAAASTPRRYQPNTGNYERVLSAGRTIGFDVVTQLYTDVYTVITDANDSLVTAHPGEPR